MKYKQPRPGIERRSPCPFPIVTSRASSNNESKHIKSIFIFNRLLKSVYIVVIIYIIFQTVIIFTLDIGIMIRVFANGPGDLGSILGRVIPKTQKMVLDTYLLNTQHYKVRIKDKVEQSRERSSALLYTLL